MSNIDTNIEKLTKAAKIMAVDNNILYSKTTQTSKVNNKIHDYLQTNKDVIDIKNKDTKFILQNSITTLPTEYSTSDINLNIDPDPGLKMLKYIFKEIYGIEISDSITTYDEAISKYKLNKEQISSDFKNNTNNDNSNLTNIVGNGKIHDDKGNELNFSLSIEPNKKVVNKELLTFLKNIKPNSNLELSTKNNLKSISTKEKTLDVSKILNTDKSSKIKAKIQVS